MIEYIIMYEENIRQEFRLKKKKKKKLKYEIFLFKETNQKELMSKNYKKICRVLTYIDHLW